MNSTDLRELRPFFNHVQHFRTALQVAGTRTRQPACICSVDPATGRYAITDSSPCAASDGPPSHCLTVVHVGVRAMLATIALPVDHLTDPELDSGIADLWGLTLAAANKTRDQFVDVIKTALHADRVAPQDGADA